MKTTNLLKESFLGMIVLILMASCVSQKNTRMLQSQSADTASLFYKNNHQMQYKVKPGDQLYIKLYSMDPKTSKFFQSDFPTLTNNTYLYLNSFLVDEDGFVSFSFIEKVMVKGMTINEIRDKLQSKFDEFFKETRVVVKLINYQVSVLGEVKSPGTFTIEKDQVTLFQAIGLAGGTTEFGNLKKVKIVRQGVDGSKVISLDLSRDKVLELESYYLLPNDVVYIEPRGTKSWAMSQFPYSTTISGLAVILSVLAILL